MAGAAGSFDRQKELGRRLAELRRRAGLKQAELAQLMGLKGRNSQSAISRLETGKVTWPSINFIADYLRACRAGFDDIRDILNRYTSQPPVAEQQARFAVMKFVKTLPPEVEKKVDAYDIKTSVARRFSGKLPEPTPKRTLRARKLAAAFIRRQKLVSIIRPSLTDATVGYATGLAAVKHLTDHSLRLWGILNRCRRKGNKNCAELLDQADAWLGSQGVLPEKAIRHVRELTERTFRAMQMSGELDALPPEAIEEDETKAPAPASARDRREDFQRRCDEYDLARCELLERIWQEVQPMLEAEGVPEDKRQLYGGTVAEFVHISGWHDEGDPQREQEIEKHVNDEQSIRQGRDPALCREVGEFALRRYSELKSTLPPDPRPRR